MQDYLRPPEIDRIDATSYTGRKGQPIFVWVPNSVRALTINVAIRKASGRLLEHGSLRGEEKGFYFAQKMVRRSQALKIEVVVTDLPGNTVRMEVPHAVTITPPLPRPACPHRAPPPPPITHARRPRSIWFPDANASWSAGDSNA